MPSFWVKNKPHALGSEAQLYMLSVIGIYNLESSKKNTV